MPARRSYYLTINDLAENHFNKKTEYKYILDFERSSWKSNVCNASGIFKDTFNGIAAISVNLPSRLSTLSSCMKN